MGTLQYMAGCDACGSSDGNGVYLQEDGQLDSSCFVCKKYTKLTEGQAAEAKAYVRKREPFDWKVWMKANTRPITIDYRVPVSLSEEYRLRESVDQANGQVDTIYYPVTTAGKITGFQAKRIAGDFPKNMKWLTYGKVSPGSLFGTSQAKGSKLVVVTEGAADTLAAKHMLREAGKDYTVVSVPNGAAGAAKTFSGDIPLIANAEKILLNFDMDEAGRAGADACADMLGADRVFMMQMTEKDACDMMAKGKGDEYIRAIFSASKPRPEGIVALESVIKTCLVAPKMGIPWPWPALNEITYGMQPRSLITIGAPPKSGKTDSQFQIVAHLVKECGQRVGVFNLEDTAAKTYVRISEKMVGKNFHSPAMPFDKDLLEVTLRDLEPHVLIYGSNGSRDWPHIEKTMLYMISEGVQVIILDNLTALVSEIRSSEANDKLNAIMTRLAYLREKYGIIILSYTHVNPIKFGTPHDWGGPVMASQFTGSRAAQKWSTQGMTLLRNQHPELPPESKNLGQIQAIMDREFGRTGVVNLEYSYETTLFSETDKKMIVGDPSKVKDESKSKNKFEQLPQPEDDQTYYED